MPAKRIFVNEIARDTVVNDVFMVVRKGVYLGKNNTRYMAVRLRDKTGSIEGRVWERVDELSTGFERNDLVRIEGRGRVYQESIQLNVTQIKKVEGELILSEICRVMTRRTRDVSISFSARWQVRINHGAGRCYRSLRFASVRAIFFSSARFSLLKSSPASSSDAPFRPT